MIMFDECIISNESVHPKIVPVDPIKIKYYMIWGNI